MIPSRLDEHDLDVRIPRESGDDPARAGMEADIFGYSPRERG